MTDTPTDAAERAPEPVSNERVEERFRLADEILRAPSRFTKDFVVNELGQAVAELAGATERARAELRALLAEREQLAAHAADLPPMREATDSAAERVRATLADHIAGGRLAAPYLAEDDVTAVLDNREVWRNLARKRGAERDQLQARLDQIGEVHEEWGLQITAHRPADARSYGYGDLGRWEARAAQQQWHRLVRREATDWRDAEGTTGPYADAVQDGAAQWTADADQPEVRDTAAWCFNRHPDHPLPCGRLAGHDGRHKRGEREWDNADA